MRTVYAFLVLLLATVPAVPQELAEWEAVPPDKSGLVVFINSDLNGRTISFQDQKGSDLTPPVKWESDLPVLQKLLVEPGSYRVHLPGPVESVVLKQAAGRLTFLKIEAYNTDGSTGIQITSWIGVPSRLVEGVFSALKEARQEDVLSERPVSAPGNALYLTIDPPFEIPPEPKPLPPPKLQ